MRVIARIGQMLAVLACTACENTPSGPAGLLYFSDLTVGPEHACAITLDARAYCWGSGALGELGVTGIQEARTPLLVPLSERLRKISAGYSHTCALSVDNNVYCWGWGLLGQIGNGARSSTGPVLVLGGHVFSSVSSGWYHTCGVAEGGAVYCWGSNNQGQLGDGSTDDNTLPVRTKLSLPVRTVSAGADHTCAVATNGSAFCWGANRVGQLGNGTSVSSLTPVAVSGGMAFSSISAGFDHTCGINTQNVGYCWGGNAYGELGNTALEREGISGSRVPQAVYGAAIFTTLEAGNNYTCGVQPQTMFGYCWGSGADGKLGTGFTSDAATPQMLAGPSGPNSTEYYLKIEAGGLRYTCGLTTASAVFCWGRGDEGELGRASVNQTVLPIRVDGT